MKRFTILIMLLLVAIPAFGLAEDNTLQVEGAAVITVQPDRAILNIGYTGENADSTTAQKHAADAIGSVIQAVKAFGIEEEDIQTTSIRTYPVYVDRLLSTKVASYRVEHMLSITLNDLSLVGDVLDVALQAGANVANNISYTASNEDEIYLQALTQAVKKAMAKAEAMAVAAGVWIGQPVQIYESSYYRPQYSRQSLETSVMMDKSDTSAAFGGTVMTSDLEITATVNIVYSIR